MSGQYNDKNILQGSFWLRWEKNGISGTSNIYSANIPKDTFEGKAYIRMFPKNRVQGSFGITAFPKQTTILYPVQDTFVDEGYPSLNFGEYSYLKIGRDAKGKRYRSFLYFDILNSIPNNIYLTKAKLILQSQDGKSFENLEIDTADRKWRENSITWNGHPLRKQLIKVQNVDGISQCEIDLFDIVKKIYDKEVIENGFLLKAFNEEVTQIKTFLSKEYAEIKSRPQLIIEYFDVNSYIDVKDKIDAFASIQSRPKGYNLFSGVACVNKEIYRNRVSAKARIYPCMIEAKANVLVKKDTFKGKAKVVYQNDELKGKAEILYPNTEKGFEAKCFISQDKINGTSKIKVPNDNLKGKVSIAYKNEINSTASVLKDELVWTGKANVRYSECINAKGLINKSYIYGKAKVIYFNDLTCRCIVNNSYIHGKASVKYVSEINGISQIANFIEGRTTVRYENNIKCRAIIGKFIDAKSKIKYGQEINCTARIKKHIDTQGKALIRYESEIECISNIAKNSDVKAISSICKKNDLLCKAKIMYCEELQCRSGIVISKYINCCSKIQKTNNKFKGISSIQSYINGTLQGRAYISQTCVFAKADIRKFNDIQGNMQIAFKKDISAMTSIRYTSLTWARCRIKSLDFSEVKCTAMISKESNFNLSYAFIM